MGMARGVGVLMGGPLGASDGKQGTEAAHLAMVAIRSVRTLLWRSVANWGDTWSSPLPSMVALGSITVARVGGGGGVVVGAERVSVSSRTLTRWLMVLRTFSTLNWYAWGSLVPSVEEDGVAIVARTLEEAMRGNLYFSLGDGGGKRKRRDCGRGDSHTCRR